MQRLIHAKSNHTIECFYEYFNKKLRYRDLIHLIFKAFGMMSLYYEVRIYQNVNNRAD